MAHLSVDSQLCVGCGLCVATCANEGIEVTDGVACPTDGCILCGMCVDACPVGAISIEKNTDGGDVSALEAAGFMVVAQTDADGALLPVSFELAAKARELANVRKVGAWALAFMQPGCVPHAEDLQRLAALGADFVAVAETDAVVVPDTAAMAAYVVAAIQAHKPEAVLFGATDLGRELAPQVAFALSSGLTADCTKLSIDAATGDLLQTRPAFGGNLLATIACPAHRPQMATVRPGVFAEGAAVDASALTVAPAPAVAVTLEDDLAAAPAAALAAAAAAAAPAAAPVSVLSRERAGEGAGLAESEVIVVAGRGIRERKNLAVVERLAELLGAQVGCTRPLVEQGWLDRSHQVGQTGTTVAPKVLISLGCSGAIQHKAGIGGARTLIAINNDPAAPIFDGAQIAVVDDCISVARALIAQLEGEGLASSAG